ncbi:CD80-like C2-set immunoglobulin domain containing protein [Nitzschia inconspicua]|uniref:CD80-like C2-set immunoglobulin domain containing protein n=1 Tax=Nitzschia inconspicua TaxID=303405 RepID=A0A9K3PUM6_9STRA|nr:CD80-like C2-set immunoglobulin domain containing protein [Nitzschia inconspicua]
MRIQKRRRYSRVCLTLSLSLVLGSTSIIPALRGGVVASHLDVHLHYSSVWDAVIVALNDTRKCPTVSELFPENTIILNGGRIERQKDDAWNDLTTTAVIALLDLQTLRICDRQRGHVVSNSFSSDNNFRITNMCMGCDEGPLPVHLDDPRFDLISSTLAVDRSSFPRKYQIARYLVHSRSAKSHENLTIRIDPSSGLYLTPEPGHQFPHTHRILESEYGIGTSDAKERDDDNIHNPQIRTTARLPILTGTLETPKQSLRDVVYTIGTSAANSRQSSNTFDDEDRCMVPLHECCENKDCLLEGEICIHRNCIDNAFLRITLKWVGDDDLDLYVVTPGGAEISFKNQFDPDSLGRFGESSDQVGSGYHVENVYFPINAPSGTYSFFVRPLITVDSRDHWTIDVVEDGIVVLSNSGFGASSNFQYTRQLQAPSPGSQSPTYIESPSRPPLGSPSTSPVENRPTSVETPTRAPNINDCSLFSNECCVDSDCLISTALCIQGTCISDGNPRFTLIWEGDDDLNLFVRTPAGAEISADNTFDEESQGKYEQDVDQSFYGHHVASIFFPLLGTATGAYEYGVRSISQHGTIDQWFVEVSEGGELVETRAGSGDSVIFTYVRRNGIDGPQRPQPMPPSCNLTQDQCCVSSDCPSASQVCIQRLCVTEGSLRITLEWIGDDDYDLFVETPSGFILSQDSNFDPETGGRFGETPSHDVFSFQLEYVSFPSSGAPLGTYQIFVKSATTRGAGADVWKMGIYEFGQLVQQESGIGDSQIYSYQRMLMASSLSPSPVPSPLIQNPEPPTEAPFPLPSQPSRGGCLIEYECCDNLDCLDPVSVCIQRTCIVTGALDFILTWTGNDSLSLVVLTPLQNPISVQSPVDEATGGIFQNDPYQPGFGFHVESIVFQNSPPSGTYSFFVKSTMTVGSEDQWTLKVYNSNELVSFVVGTGDSRTMSYDYQQILAPSSPPFPSTVAPIPMVTPTPVPPSIAQEECDSKMCEMGTKVCIQATCVSEGNPRMTLQWTGNDKLGLVVVTPDGTTISSDFTFDPVSGGKFEIPNEWSDNNVQNEFGRQTQNIYFPLSGGPVGVYQYYITRTPGQGPDNSWIITVAIGGNNVEMQQGAGVSDVFVFRYLGGINPPSLEPGGCEVSTDCTPGQFCVEQSCIEQGIPQFVLAYLGDDDLDLYVITPLGTTIFSQNRNDVPSGGRFGDNGNSDGVQDTPGNHIEYVYFAPNQGPVGIYQYYVESFRATDDDDPWTITVFIAGQVVSVESGLGSSEVFVFDFDSMIVPTVSPNLPPIEALCNNATAECCMDDACFPNEACTFQTCVDEGNPRFTLSWEGENDLDLLVQTPLGTVISFSNADDHESGGKFGEEFDQFVYGRHVENIYFPMSGGPVGEYSIFVRSFLSDGMDDEYTVQVYVHGQLEFSFSGSGDSDGLTYMFQGLPGTPPSTPIAVSPSTAPPSVMMPTEIQQVEECNQDMDECCSDLQCMVGIEVCTQRTCIDVGLLRFTLEWTGEDDLDLVVQTPLGTTVSFPYPIDEATGGIFGEGGTQNLLGTHVENVYFDSPSIPTGVYLYNVSSFEKRGPQDDNWSISVFLNNALVDIKNGTGDSDTYTFNLEEGYLVGRSHVPQCNLLVEDCCDDKDCNSNQVCALNMCINEGLPRFTLEYIGDDHIDLTVVTPIGTTLSFSNPVDDPSNGRFESVGDVQIVGKRVQNVYFAEGLIGAYTYFISTFDLNNDPNEWTIKVFEGAVETVTFTGSGNSDFRYEFYLSSNPPTTSVGTSGMASSMELTSPSPQVRSCQTPDNECCTDGDCEVGTFCRSGSCISDGNPRFSLTWEGSDKYELSVKTPTGGVVLMLNQFDEESSGRFDENMVQNFIGMQVKNVYFPGAGGPFGTYTAEITSLESSTGAMPTAWTLEIAAGGDVATVQVGSGSSGPLTFEYELGNNLRTIGVTDPICNPPDGVMGACCNDSDCLSHNSICVSNTCIDNNGRLRFTLTWYSDEGHVDDLDLVVVTPEGKTMHFDHDQSGSLVEDVGASRSRSHHRFGSQVESVSFFPDPTIGSYTYQVKSIVTLGREDPWVLQVFIDGELASGPHTGNGTSQEFSFYFHGGNRNDENTQGVHKREQNAVATGTDAFDHSSVHLGNVYGIGNAAVQKGGT